MFSGTRLENAFDGLAVRSTPYIWVSFYSAISTVIKYLVEKNAGTSHFSSTCLSLLQLFNPEPFEVSPILFSNRWSVHARQELCHTGRLPVGISTMLQESLHQISP
ncbi:hypothetical protein V6Z93_007411, partial [Aspergillus fumigatus]